MYNQYHLAVDSADGLPKRRIQRRIKSYAQRGRALTPAQQRLYTTGMQSWGIRPLLTDWSQLLAIHQQRVAQAALMKASGLAPTTNPQVVLEIGFGNGDNLLALATSSPGDLFIGAEVYTSGLLKLLCEIRRRNLHNLYLYDGDALDLIQSLPDQVLDKCYILFADPWPKRKHHKRRLLQAAFLRQLHSKCHPGAKLLIATDWAEYAASITTELQQSGCWQHCTLIHSDNDSDNQYKLVFPVTTKFEQRAIAQQRAIYRFICSISS